MTGKDHERTNGVVTPDSVNVPAGQDWLQYDPVRDVLTIDGRQFSRELFRCINETPCGVSLRIVERHSDGAITLTREEDPRAMAAPELLAALQEAAKFSMWDHCPNGKNDFVCLDTRCAPGMCMAARVDRWRAIIAKATTTANPSLTVTDSDPQKHPAESSNTPIPVPVPGERR